MALLGKYVDIKTGKLDANASVEGGQYPFFTCSRNSLEIDKYAFDADAILVAGNGDLNVKHYKGKFNAYQRTYVITISDIENLDSRYLYHWMFKYVDRLRELSIGGVIKYIKLGMLTDAEIPLPSLKEQKRIAEILDKADAIRRKRQQAIDLTAQLLRSIFLDMFGDPAKNPKRYRVGKIEDLLSSVNYGTSAKAGEEGAYPILRMNNITYGGDLNLDNLKYINMNKKERKKYTVERGDILFNRTNSKELVGKTAVFREKEPYIFAGYLVRSKVNSLAKPEYISSFLNSIYGKTVLRHMCKSIVGMANINAKEYQSIKILIPPLEEQEIYTSLVDRNRGRIFIYECSLNKSNELYDSLSQKAFRGEL